MSERKGEFFSATSNSPETLPGGEIEADFNLWANSITIKREDILNPEDAEELHDILRLMQQELWALIQFLKNERNK